MSADDPTRVVVADDQTVVREGLVMLLGLLPDIEVAGSAPDGDEALRLVAQERPHIALMDLRMPRTDGVAATRRIRADHPETQVVVLTTYSDDDSVFAGLRAGARGYLTKDAPAEEIARAIAAVREGNVQFDPVVQQRLAEKAVSYASESSGDETQSRPVRERSLPDGLTSREGEVLAMIADGQSNPEIAAVLYITEATVKTHVNNLFTKAGLRDRAQAVTYAFRNGLVGTDPRPDGS